MGHYTRYKLEAAESGYRTPPDLRALRARKRRAWGELVEGETVEISIDLGMAYALETRGNARRFSPMVRLADLAVQTVTGGEVIGRVTMKDEIGARFPTRKALIRDGRVVMDGAEWWCEHAHPALPPLHTEVLVVDVLGRAVAW